MEGRLPDLVIVMERGWDLEGGRGRGPLKRGLITPVHGNERKVQRNGSLRLNVLNTSYIRQKFVKCGP